MLMGKGAAICWATKIAEAGAEDALGKQIANNQPQCLLQLWGSSKQLVSLSERRWMKHFFVLGSGAASARIWIVLVTTF